MVGIYLPVERSVPIFVGGLAAHGAGRSLARRQAQEAQGFEQAAARSTRRGLLFASGLITGEVLVGIALAVPIAFTQNQDVVAASRLGLEPSGFVQSTLGMAIFASPYNSTVWRASRERCGVCFVRKLEAKSWPGFGRVFPFC